MKFKFMTDYTDVLQDKANRFIEKHNIIRMEFLSNDKYGRITALIQYDDTTEE